MFCCIHVLSTRTGTVQKSNSNGLDTVVCPDSPVQGTTVQYHIMILLHTMYCILCTVYYVIHLLTILMYCAVASTQVHKWSTIVASQENTALGLRRPLWSTGNLSRSPARGSQYLC